MNVNGILGKYLIFHKLNSLSYLFLVLSENYIFGKFEAFCRRVDKVADVINVIESLASLNVVKIEGLEAIIVKYKSIVDTIKKKSYGK